MIDALELWQGSTPNNRCPYVSFDGENCRCNVDPDEKRKTIGSPRPIFTNILSQAELQIWCLDGDNYEMCVFYRKKPISDLSE